MEIENERLRKNYAIALNIIKTIIGEDTVKKQMRRVLEVKISPRAVQRHGICKYIGNSCVIEVSKHLFRVDDEEMVNTLIHEILHTFKDTKGHNYQWKWYAKQISNNTKYKIERTGTSEALAIEDYNYLIICEFCGTKTKRMRISQRNLLYFQKNRYRCTKCGNSNFKIKDLRGNKIIL